MGVAKDDSSSLPDTTHREGGLDCPKHCPNDILSIGWGKLKIAKDCKTSLTKDVKETSMLFQKIQWTADAGLQEKVTKCRVPLVSAVGVCYLVSDAERWRLHLNASVWLLWKRLLHTMSLVAHAGQIPKEFTHKCLDQFPNGQILTWK